MLACLEANPYIFDGKWQAGPPLQTVYNLGNISSKNMVMINIEMVVKSTSGSCTSVWFSNHVYYRLKTEQ